MAARSARGVHALRARPAHADGNRDAARRPARHGRLASPARARRILRKGPRLFERRGRHMTDWKPILQGRPTRGIERLLGSARLDVPRPGGVARTVAALGLASGVTATAGVSAASASSAGASVLVKWLAIGAATGVVVTGTGEAIRYGVTNHD